MGDICTYTHGFVLRGRESDCSRVSVHAMDMGDRSEEAYPLILTKPAAFCSMCENVSMDIGQAQQQEQNATRENG